MSEPITAAQFHDAAGIDDWRVVGDGVCAYFRTGSVVAGLRFVAALGELPDLAEFGPELDLRADGVLVRLIQFRPSYFGLVQAHVERARQISAIANAQQLTADPASVQSVHISIDALDIPAILPFWRAVLNYVDRTDTENEDLVDPLGRGVPIWFQEMDAIRPERNHIHVDVWVPHDQIEQRVQAALAAGGVLRSSHAPVWWGLADAEGNEVDVTSWVGH